MKKSNLAIHAATAAFTPARALTSHLRRRYRERYLGRYRRSRLVFAFDFFLVCVAAVAIGVDIFIATTVPRRLPDVGLYFSAPPIITAKPIAFEATVTSQGEAKRAGMRLAWDLPPGTEIISASPALDTSGEAYLGDVEPKQSQTARIVVRLFSDQSSVRLGFRVHNADGYAAGDEVRPVVGSGLTLEAMVKPDAVDPDAFIPYRVKNDTALPIERVVLRANEKDIAGNDLLPPYAEVIALVPAQSPFRVQAFAHGLALAHDDRTFTVGGSLPISILNAPVYQPGKRPVVAYESVKPSQLFVYHPGLSDASNGVRVLDVPAKRGTVELPIDPAFSAVVDEWFVIPLWRDGNALHLGLATYGKIVTAFSVTAQARYYAATGDQIGIGPLPPKIGETTKYWVSWKLDATTADLSGLEFRAPVPDGVKVTGRMALPDGGTLAEKDGVVVWSLPSLAAQSQGVSAAFEIALTPTAKGTVWPLLGETSAKAAENRSGLELTETAPALTTEFVK